MAIPKYFIPFSLLTKKKPFQISSDNQPTSGIDLYQYIIDVSGATMTANNGLTVTGSNIQFGGPLVQDTNIIRTFPSTKTAALYIGDLGGFGLGKAGALISTNPISGEHSIISSQITSTLNQTYDGTGNFSSSGTNLTQGLIAFHVSSTGDNKLFVDSTGLHWEYQNSNRYTFPIGDGSANQVMTTNGSGVLSWSNGGGWSLLGNSGTVVGTNFIGTSDNVDVEFKRNGVIAGYLNTSKFTTSFGVNSLNSPLTSTIGQNTAFGYFALQNNAQGWNNVAIGLAALQANTDGIQNVALGSNTCLGQNTTGNSNTAIGNGSLQNNITGSSLTAIGQSSNVDADGYSNSGTFGGTIKASNEFSIADAYTTFRALINTPVIGYVLTATTTTGNAQWKLPTPVIKTQAYGTTFTASATDINSHLYFTTSTGATTVDLTLIPIGAVVIISDLDGISSTSNITIDSGAGKTIRSQGASAQTFVMNQNGESVTIQKLTSTKLMII